MPELRDIFSNIVAGIVAVLLTAIGAYLITPDGSGWWVSTVVAATVYLHLSITHPTYRAGFGGWFVVFVVAGVITWVCHRFFPEKAYDVAALLGVGFGVGFVVIRDVATYLRVRRKS
jgi:hypothetical protein